MPVFYRIQELGNGRKSGRATNSNISESNNSETNPIMSAHWNNTEDESKNTHPNSGRSQRADKELHNSFD